MAGLAALDVLVIDCQATMAGPRGRLLEIGWLRAGDPAARARARLIRLPDGVPLPPAVARVTGLTEAQVRSGCDVATAARELAGEATAVGGCPTPAVAHYARFEQSLLPALVGGPGPLTLDLVCTHAIARRFYPELPRRGLRALAGYLGAAVPPLRRSTDHVEATAFVWRILARRLAEDGVDTWAALHAWLAVPAPAAPARRVWPMPRGLRLALPGGPGVYRFLRAGGDVLYVGKAASLHDRVNSYFRRQHGTPERLLEMLTQARDLSYTTAATALEAALLECDEIKRHRAPYNVALAEDGRSLWFTTRDLAWRQPRPERAYAVGPFASADTLDRFTALVAGRPEALREGASMPPPDVFEAARTAVRARHPELAAAGVPRQWLHVGTRLWREGRRDGDLEDRDGEADTWSAARVERAIESLAIRAAWSRRRARWLARLAEATLTWRESASDVTRQLIVENGQPGQAADIAPEAPPAIPPGHARAPADRLAGFTVASYDRLRVLTTELKRLAASGAPIAVRFGPGPALRGARLRRLLDSL